MSIRRSVLVVVIGVLVAMLSPLAANAQEPAEGVTCTLPESDAEALVILNNYYPGYQSSARGLRPSGRRFIVVVGSALLLDVGRRTFSGAPPTLPAK
jgi:hypothetical protein